MSRPTGHMLLAPGTRPPDQILLNTRSLLVVRLGQRWLIETRRRVVAGNSLPKAVLAFVDLRVWPLRLWYP